MLNAETQRVVDEVKEMKNELRDVSKAIRRVEHKVFNGFGNRIDSVNEKLDGEIKTNAQAHAELKQSLSGVMRFIAIALVSIFVAIIGVLGAVWASDSRGQARIDSALRGLENVSKEHSVIREDINAGNDSIDLIESE